VKKKKVKKKLPKMRIRKVEALAPNVQRVELEIIDAPEPPALPSPAEPIDLSSDTDGLPPEKYSWWRWLRTLW
jgi:hypothetical protein